MRFKDDPNVTVRPAGDILDELHELSLRLRAATKEDGGPAKLKLPSGQILEGEAAEMWLRFQDGVFHVLDE